MTNPETGTGYYDPIMIENGYWNLLKEYGWTKEDHVELGPAAWTGDNINYNIIMKPFYVSSVGRIRIELAAAYDAGYEGWLWSSAAMTYNVTKDPDGGLVYGFNERYGVSVSSSYERSRGLALRCLTQ